VSEPVISFDLDGVLMQNPFREGVEPRVRELVRGAPALRELAAHDADQRITAAIRAEVARRMAAGDLVGAYDWDATYATVSRAFGGPSIPDVAGLVEEACRAGGMIYLLPGAREGLELLRDAGLRLVALTNGYRAFQWPVLEALGISGLFEDLVSPERTGYAKPDPRLFLAVEGLTAHVGDTLVHDVLGANQAGVASVWLDHNLPADLRSLPPAERAGAPAFLPYLEGALERTIHREHHPEATLESCKPDLVVTDAHEAAQAVLTYLGR
jgi:putative hydrolase of the HAD superfamily